MPIVAPPQVTHLSPSTNLHMQQAHYATSPLANCRDKRVAWLLTPWTKRFQPFRWVFNLTTTPRLLFYQKKMDSHEQQNGCHGPEAMSMFEVLVALLYSTQTKAPYFAATDFLYCGSGLPTVLGGSSLGHHVHPFPNENVHPWVRNSQTTSQTHGQTYLSHSSIKTSKP